MCTKSDIPYFTTCVHGVLEDPRKENNALFPDDHSGYTFPERSSSGVKFV